MKIKTLFRLVSLSKSYRILLYGIIFFSLLTTMSSLLVPVLLGQAIDLLISKGQVDVVLLFEKIMKIGFVLLFVVSAQWLLSKQTNKITYLISYDLRKKTYDKIHDLTINYIDTHKHGEMINYIISDVELVSNGLLQSFTSLFTGIITIIGTIIILCFIHLEVALIILFLTPISLFVAMFIAKKTHNRFVVQVQKRSELTGYANEMISNIELVHCLNYEQVNEVKFDDINRELHRNGILFQFYGALINPTTRFINSFIYNLIAIAGSLFVVQGSFTVGMLSSFLTYANQYTKPFNEISAVINEMQAAVVASVRIFNFLDEEVEVDDGIYFLEDVQGNVEFKDVVFRYNKDIPLLENINTKINAGQTVAIVGKTGSGKTTLINLLMRFYDLNKGKILIDGVSIELLSKVHLRQMFGMVLQDSWIFNGTIRDNICYGIDGVDEEKLITTCKEAMLHDFVMTLEHGYDTLLGSEGIILSKGQQQLVCIARIMLMNPPILLLDEATSSIDTRTESKIQIAFDTMMKDKTCFIVAHRLSTIKNADTILVMDQGSIVEQGNHYELLEQKGYYYNLYQSQYQNEKVS